MGHPALSQTGNPVVACIPKIHDSLIGEIWVFTLNSTKKFPISRPPLGVFFVIVQSELPEE
ncbi:hypothetical protein, partial [Klebsiella pneumoniae]|uniref:hypothetical protein n=1 Tax=Klebsiella pneumoniae TaxID=573 RepID=UPI001C6F9C72